MMEATWEDVIGHDRERQLLDSAMSVMLELKPDRFDGADPFEAVSHLCDKIAVDWREGHLVNSGYTLDDLAGVSHRIGELTAQQSEAMLRHYREMYQQQGGEQ